MKGKVIIFSIFIFMLVGCQASKEETNEKITKQIRDQGWEIELDINPSTVSGALDGVYIKKKEQLFYVGIWETDDDENIYVDNLGYINSKQNEISFIYNSKLTEELIIIDNEENETVCRSDEENCDEKYHDKIEERRNIMKKSLEELDLTFSEIKEWAVWYINKEVYKKSSYILH